MLGGEDLNPDLPSDNGDSSGHGIDGVDEDEDGDRGEDDDNNAGEDDEGGEDQKQPADSDEDSDEEERWRDSRHHPSQSAEGEWDESDEELSL